MGQTKTEIFTEKQNKIAQLAKAIAHPARIAILEYLVKSNSCICGDIVDELGLAQATVSQHLKELKNVGIIQGIVEGTKVCYCIDTVKWNEIRSTFSQFFDQSLEAISCC